MPYKIKRLNKKNVQVINKDNGKIKSKKTTIEKAKKQIKLLHMKEHNKYI